MNTSTLLDLNTFATRHGIALAGSIPNDVFRLIFLKVIEKYLRREISVHDFFSLISEMEWIDHEAMHGKDVDSPEPDDLIEYFVDNALFSAVSQNEPGPIFLQKEAVEDQDYTFDPPLNEILRYFVRNRDLID